MDNRLNIGIALAILSGAVMFLAKMKGEDINVGNFFALAILVAVLLIAPLIGLVLIIPVTILVWFRYYKHALNFFYSLWGGKHS